METCLLPKTQEEDCVGADTAMCTPALEVPLQAQMQNGGDNLRIAIVGAGVAGPALAALLCRLEQPPQVDIFERGPRDMDQGGGYDLDNKSRSVLEAAGVKDRYWEMTRPESNTMSSWIQGKTKAFASLTQPRCCHSCFDPKYETNRTKLREVFLDAVERHVSLAWNCTVDGLRKVGNKVELLGREDAVLGLYDLVVDTSGVGSNLRRYRVQESGDDNDPENVDKHLGFKKAYTGVSMVHGVILDPEASCDASFVQKLGQGTVSIVGPRGKSFTVQRYGADTADHRASLYKFVSCPEGPDQLVEMLGLPGRASQWQTGEAMEKIRTFLRDDLGEEWEASYSSVIGAIDFAAIRPILLHRTTTFRDNDLPLICIGDALHVVPPWTGRGGNLAMVDALDVGQWLVDLLKRSQPIPIEGLRKLEKDFMTRQIEQVSPFENYPKYMAKFQEALKDTPDMSDFSCYACADILCEESFGKRIGCKTAICCCRPICNVCGCMQY